MSPKAVGSAEFMKRGLVGDCTNGKAQGGCYRKVLVTNGITREIILLELQINRLAQDLKIVAG